MDLDASYDEALDLAGGGSIAHSIIEELDADTLADRAVTIAGDPDSCIEALKKHEATGIDQMMIMMQTATIPHEKVMKSIELFGKCDPGIQKVRGGGRRDRRLAISICPPVEKLLPTSVQPLSPDGITKAQNQGPHHWSEVKQTQDLFDMSPCDAKPTVGVLLNATPIRSEDGVLASFVVTPQGMTPLKEVERLRAEFLAMVSHELRRP